MRVVDVFNKAHGGCHHRGILQLVLEEVHDGGVVVLGGVERAAACRGLDAGEICPDGGVHATPEACRRVGEDALVGHVVVIVGVAGVGMPSTLIQVAGKVAIVPCMQAQPRTAETEGSRSHDEPLISPLHSPYEMHALIDDEADR